MSVNHSLHGFDKEDMPWADPARKEDASAGCMGFHFSLRKRRTSDGYTRIEGTILAPVKHTDGAVIFVVYVNDDERRRMAAALLEGLA